MDCMLWDFFLNFYFTCNPDHTIIYGIYVKKPYIIILIYQI